MGRGDKKSAKGKRAMGSYGNTRKRKTSTFSKAVATEKTEAKAVKEKKAPAKKAATKKETTAEN